MADNPPSKGGDGTRITYSWDTKEAMQIVLDIHDGFAASVSKGSQCLHPKDIAAITRLKRFLESATKNAMRVCFCGRNYCRSRTEAPCRYTTDELRADPSLIYSCKYRGKEL